MKTINWNGRVRIRLNERGWNIYEKSFTDLHIDPPNRCDTVEMELWEAANIFGSSLYNGCSSPFEDLSMEYTSPY